MPHIFRKVARKPEKPYPMDIMSVPEARFELACLATVDFKSTVYTVPPLGATPFLIITQVYHMES